MRRARRKEPQSKMLMSAPPIVVQRICNFCWIVSGPVETEEGESHAIRCARQLRWMAAPLRRTKAIGNFSVAFRIITCHELWRTISIAHVILFKRHGRLIDRVLLLP